MNLDNLHFDYKDETIRLYIPEDMVDISSEIISLFGLEVKSKKEQIHMCGSPYGCDCPTMPWTRVWAERTFKLTSVNEQSGFNFFCVGKVDNFINKLEDDLQVYTFITFGGGGICFKLPEDRFKYSVAIVID